MEEDEVVTQKSEISKSDIRKEKKGGERRGPIKLKDILSRLKDKTQNKETDTYLMSSPEKLQRGGR